MDEFSLSSSMLQQTVQTVFAREQTGNHIWQQKLRNAEVIQRAA